MQTTVFYSYKGGLGRSLALAWCARALAREGKPTVAIDFDLEAPGLAYKLGFSIDDDLGPGLVDLLLRYQSGQSPPDDLGAWLKKVEGDDQLWLLPAGPGVSGRYWRDLAAIDWDRMFFGGAPDGVRFFHWLRQAIEKSLHPAHLLVDARTGVTEMGGAALTLMADQILALLGTSLEGIHGTREVLRGVVAGANSNQRPRPRIALVLSRMSPLLGPEDLHRLRRAVRDEVCSEANPLSSTVHCELPVVVRSEPCLQTDERDALRNNDLRVQIDYHAVLSWITGSTTVAPLYESGVDRMSTADSMAQSVELHRRLVAVRPDLYRADLAESLRSLSRTLTELGRREDALSAAEEAVRQYRILSADGNAVFQPSLAGSLSDLSNHLSDLGRRENALAAIEEAASLYRTLAQHNPDEFLPSLAMSLNNLGNCLADLDRRDEALTAADEAAQLYRKLAEQRPDNFLPNLAASLNNLSGRLAEQGRRRDAIRTAREAARNYRTLAKTRPDAFLPDLAMSLSNLGNRLADLDRREEALAAANEAVVYYRELAGPRAETFLPSLAASLNNLGIHLAKLGSQQEAFAAASEAVELCRKLAGERPDRFRPDLALSLNNLAGRLTDLGRSKEALDAAAESVQVTLELTRSAPSIFLPRLHSRTETLHEIWSKRAHWASEQPPAILWDAQEKLRELGIEDLDSGR